ncbi:MAG: metal-dependent hydrolase [Chloroflexi bacterium]|nr:metal-dependent hydrolase [Chloroflexota bacterium]MBU1751047.1 metal-dependent hydrolase [Chloroflexota bacterium]MBU1877733.1 metal-dependent hydrolase [Chloroflexota bacterium]
MFPTGHIAYTSGGLALLQARGWAPDVDYRLVALVALAPDLVDKPLSLLVFTDAQTTQGLCHSLIVHLAITALVLLFARRFWPYALVLNLHLACDQIWRYPHTMLWPLLGPNFEPWKPIEGVDGFLVAYAEIAARPEVLTLELVGLAMVLVLVASRRLYQPARLAAFLRTGRLPYNGHHQPAPERVPCA